MHRWFPRTTFDTMDGPMDDPPRTPRTKGGLCKNIAHQDGASSNWVANSVAIIKGVS